jgi:hypothetical protein
MALSTGVHFPAMRRWRILIGIVTVAVAGAAFAAPASARSPSNANITFQVGSTVTQVGPSTIVAHAVVTWSPGASNVGAGCCTNEVTDSLGTIDADTTANRFPFTWNSDDPERFQIDSYDARGLYVGSAFTNAPTFVSQFGEESDAGGTYTGAWQTQTTANAIDGSLHFSTAKGASATFASTVRTLGWITTVGPTHGSARVYVDGHLAQTVSTHASTTGYRRIAFARAWFAGPEDPLHTIKIVNAGTAGHSRVDVDGFINVAED